MFDEEYTVFCGNLSDQVTEEILFELFLQAGPVEDVRIPVQDGRSRSFGFIVFKHRDSVEYAINLFKTTKLFGKPLVLQNRLLQSQMKAKARLGWTNGDYEADLRPEEMGPWRKKSSHSRHDDAGLSALRGGSSLGHSSRDDLKPRGSRHEDRPLYGHDVLRNIPPPHLLPLLNSSLWMPPSYPAGMLPYSPYEGWDRTSREASHRESAERHRHSEKRRHGSGRHHHRHSRSRSRDPSPQNNYWKKSNKNHHHRH